MLSLLIDAEAGIFCALDKGYLLPAVDLKAGTEITEFTRLPVGGMFQIQLCFINGVRVGFYFTTPFLVDNAGGYLVTHMAKKREATETEVMIKTDELVVYHFPNCGTLAVSPLVNEDVATIFEEQ